VHVLTKKEREKEVHQPRWAKIIDEVWGERAKEKFTPCALKEKAH